MADNEYDFLVIGAGPGGYIAAIRAAQLGLKTALVEKRKSLGGTCLNVGCIPSKALLHSSHLYEGAKKDFAVQGVKSEKITLDLKTMMAHKASVVGDTIKGLDFLISKNNIERFVGAGTITAKGEVTLSPGGKGKKQVLNSKAIVIATGSDVASLAGIDIDEKQIVSSTGALEFPKVPNTMVVIGAGVIGLELASVWRRLGAEVTVVEVLDHILLGMDGEISKQMERILKRQGFNFRLSSKVIGVKKAKTGVTVAVERVNGGDVERIKADVVLVSVGRVPYTEGLGLENIGIKLDEHGFVPVNDYFQTSAEGVYAIGDVIGGVMLAHKAEDEGVVLAEMIAGQSGHIDYDTIPSIIYTWPEVAGVGKTEEQLKQAGIKYNTGKFPFTANARARAMGDSDGFVKILADAETDRILGAHIIGATAGDLIQECVVAMEFGGSAEDIARTCHGHPGLSEVVKEAALAVAGRALHI